MQRNLRYLGVIFLIIALTSQSQPVIYSMQAQSGGELSVPERVDLEADMFSSGGNDIFFQSPVDNALLSHQYQSDETTFDLYGTDGLDRSPLGNYNAFNPFSASNPNQIYHANNQSAEELSLEYSTTYYDMTGGVENAEKLDNLVLFQNEMSGLRFYGNESQPLIFDMKFKGQTDIIELEMYLVSPSGQVADYGFIFSNQFDTFVHEFIPVVPSQDGIYTLYLSPVNDDIILESLQLYDTPPVQDITKGYTDKMQGNQTITNLFRIDPSNFTLANDSAPVMLDLNSQIFIHEAIQVYSKQVELLGNLEIKYFTSTTSAFGSTLPDTVIQSNSSDVFVSVTATPPNEENQFIKAEKEELGLLPGFDAEYAFWVESYEITELDPNTDVAIEAQNQPNANHYYFSTGREQIIGMNSTDAVTATVTDLNNPGMVYTLDSNANDLNLASSGITVLPAGDYRIEISGLVGEEARLQAFVPQSINIDEKSTFVFGPGQAEFFRLPVTLPAKEYFNVTYLDDLNMTVDMDFTLYNSIGDVMLSVSDTLGQDLQGNDNNTLIGNTNLQQQYNAERGYFRVASTGNIRYEDDLTTINDTNVDVDAKFSLHRLNYLDLWDDQSAEQQLLRETYATGISEDLNTTKTGIVFAYDLSSVATPQGYKLDFSAVNMSYRVLVFADWDNIWINELVDTPEVIGGFNTYQTSLEFATSKATSLSIILIFDPSGTDDGVFSSEFSSFTIQETPGIELQQLSSVSYIDALGLDDGSFLENLGGTLGDLFTNPITYAVIAGLAASIGAIVYYLKTKGKI